MGVALKLRPLSLAPVEQALTVPTNVAARLEPRLSALAPGAVLPGGYTLGACIGSGGMGRVFKAEQRSLGRPVAIKIAHPHVVANPSVLARLSVEAIAASRVLHSGSVKIYDFRAASDHSPFLVMEHIEGRRLSDFVKRPAMSVRRCVGLVVQLLWTLEEAHRSGVLHRDVKPDNILVTTDRAGREQVKLVDYGLALVTDGERVLGSTLPGVMYGTPGYMSPEQADGEPVDARTDVYSAAVVLNALLTCCSPSAAMVRSSGGEAGVIARSIPAPLALILARALENNPMRRLSSAADFAHRLTAAMTKLARVDRTLTLHDVSVPLLDHCG